MFAARPPARAARREEARRLLAAYDLDGIEAWAGAEPLAAQLLQQLLFDRDELLCWRAAEAIGRVAAVRAREGLEPVRELIRRTLWLMNDESGGLLRYGPQLLGALLANVPALSAEFAPVVASFLEEEPFRAGTRWALWRLAAAAPRAVADVAAELVASLADPDPAVRGLAALALRAAGAGDPSPDEADGARFPLFDPRTGEMRLVTVGEAARGGTP